jgi:dihydrofolate synthase/folylpolyglutamate synthase
VTPEEAERYLLSRELFGMRFGLDRMRRLLTALEHPERRFRSVHVVGTNGKSSTTRMTAAILAAHGMRVGAYLSPHLVSFSERIQVDQRDLTPGEFAEAVTRVARAAELVERSLDSEDRVTLFELLTAAAFSELARRGVDVGVIEAGLGGRYDATNVIPSEVQVLTGVGLEHTRWLGPTITAISREKLDVVRPHGRLVLGADLDPDAEAVAVEVARERDATVIHAGTDPGVAVGAPGRFQLRNFALARAVAEQLHGPLDPDAVAAAAARVRVPGRLQVVDDDPLTVLDGAHNPDGIAAVAESLPDVMAGPPAREGLVAVISILDDKDASRMLATLLPLCDGVVFTASRNPRVLPPPTLESLAGQLPGTRHTEVVKDPVRALARGRELAGPRGLVLAIGSIYLIGDLLTARSDAAAVTLPRASSR